MGRYQLAGLDRRVPRGAWSIVLAGGLAVWIVPALAMGLTATFVDWQIYREAAALWHATGSPYPTLPAGWDPDIYHPYLYPPTSWPFLAIVDVIPPGILCLALAPFVLVRPRRWASPLVAILLLVAAVPTILLGNVNALVAGALVVAFLPGVAGGVGLAVAVALKGYPILLVPLLWRDRRRLLVAVAVLAALAISGTALWGFDGWANWLSLLSNEGRYVDTLNPLSDNRVASLGIALIGIAGGLVLGSPAIILTAFLLASPAVYVHYLLTIAAGLVSEPRLVGRTRRLRVGRLRKARPAVADETAPR